MLRTTIVLLLVLFIPATPLYAEVVDFKTLTLEELQSFETEGLSKKETKQHKKALKKAIKAKKREERKNAPRAPYCSKLARSRGQCY